MENTLIKEKYNKTNIYQAKPLIEACKEFDLNEGRLFYLSLLELRPQLSAKIGQKEFERITIPSADVIKLFGGNKAYYQRLKNVAKRLQSRLVTVKEDNETFHRLNIFREMQFDKKKGGLAIRFNEDMRPYILELAGKPYTKIAARTIFTLNSVYAIRLLELLLEYQNIPTFQQNGRIERYISVEDMRFYCNVDKSKYSKTSDFTRNVIKRPLEDINCCTGYKVSFSCKKNGRAIVGYNFVMEMSADIGNITENIEQISKIIENDRKERASKVVSGFGMYAELIRNGIGKIVARRLVASYSTARIRNNIEYTMQQTKIKNKAAYLRRAIEDDYASTRRLVERDTLSKACELDNTAGDLAELKKLGFGKTVAQNFISVVKSRGRFGITERNLCDKAGIVPEALFDALKRHDFSELCTTKYKHDKVVSESNIIPEQCVIDSEPIDEIVSVEYEPRTETCRIDKATAKEIQDVVSIPETRCTDKAPEAISKEDEAREMKELTRLMQMQLRVKLPKDLQRRLDELSDRLLGM